MGHQDLDLAAVARLDDATLMDGLHRLVQQDRALTARLLVHIGEVEARGLYREQAFSSMFEYAVEALHLSEDEAYVRLRAAKVAREFPLVLRMLERNELHLSAIKLLAPHLTQANCVEVLERARAKSKREVERLVAELAPKPDVPSVVRKLPAARPSVRVVPQPTAQPASVEWPARELRLEPSMQTQSTIPLSAGRYKVQFTATQALHDKLQQLKDLLRHQIPDGDLCAIFERAADSLIEQQLKRRFAQTTKPRGVAPDAVHDAASTTRRVAQTEEPSAAPNALRDAASTTQTITQSEESSAAPNAVRDAAPLKRPVAQIEKPRSNAPDAAPDAASMRRRLAQTEKPSAAPDAVRDAASMRRRVTEIEKPRSDASRDAAPWSRYVPRAVVRAVYARDGGQCTFVSSAGRRCRARDHLELHHEDPFAHGGPATVENLRLVCQTHNALLAERDFGRAYIQRKRRQNSRNSVEVRPTSS